MSSSHFYVPPPGKYTVAVAIKKEGSPDIPVGKEITVENGDMTAFGFYTLKTTYNGVVYVVPAASIMNTDDYNLQKSMAGLSFGKQGGRRRSKHRRSKRRGTKRTRRHK